MRFYWFWGAFAQTEASKPIVTNLSEILNQVEYPLEARHNAIEGNVTITVKVSEKGEIMSYEVKNACDPILKKAIEEIIPNMQFIPAITPEGRTVQSEIEIPFKFRLDIS